MDVHEIQERFAQSAKYEAEIDAEVLKIALFHAGAQWGHKTPEDILAAIDAAGFMVIRKPRPKSADDDLERGDDLLPQDAARRSPF